MGNRMTTFQPASGELYRAAPIAGTQEKEMTITLPPPYHLIETTLDMEMNTRIKQAKRRNTRLIRRRKQVEEIDEQAMNAERIEADPELGHETNKGVWLIAAFLLITIIGGIFAAWS